MKKLSFTLSLIITSLLFISCNSSFDEKEVRIVTNDFLQAMHKPADFKKMKELYPKFSFSSVPRVTEHSVTSINEENGKVTATIYTNYITSSNEKIPTNFALELRNVNEVWKITNSKGLSNFKSMYPNVFKYALENNYFTENDDLWDLELNTLMKKAKNEMPKE